MSDSLRCHGLQNVRLPCPSKSSGACSNSCQLSQWCHPIVSSYVILFSFCLLSILASGSFPMSWLFISCDWSFGASDLASVLPRDIQDWFPLGLTGLILQSKGLSRVFFSTTVQKHQSFGTQGFPGGSAGKESACNVGDLPAMVPSLGWEDPLEKERATHSRILAWRIPWTV